MGYEINSTWTKLREKDIKKLNEIIDDKYYKELEISCKLNIMKYFNEEFEKEIKNIYWNNILDYMKKNNWTWYFGNDMSNSESYRVPTKEDMIHSIETNLFKRGLYKIIEMKEKHYSGCTGGFCIEMGYEGDNYWVDIYFDIAHFKV